MKINPKLLSNEAFKRQEGLIIFVQYVALPILETQFIRIALIIILGYFFNLNEIIAAFITSLNLLR